MIRAALAALSLVLAAPLTAPEASAQSKASALFASKPRPARGKSEVFGFYSKGCAAGLVELPETGPRWQAMRLSRNRNWGHPEMIEFIERLSAQAVKFGWPGIYVGDISQPRGGPSPSGHSSHQTGLDVDIWYTRPSRLNLTRGERESLGALIVRNNDQRTLNNKWTNAHAALLEAAARDPMVDRIFVTAPIKISMCQKATRRDKKWLQKIRPLYGHHDHFHVRLKCPRGSPDCVVQSPGVDELSKGGDGCDESLMWWVTDYLNPPKVKADPNARKAPRKRHPRDYVMADLPRSCVGVLNSD
ncbi:penicillin-insensitive murein endopeptidase [Vannielia litorea]|uniref:Murein endopeptidase. Metallo peptidase. MEROPS family M74 n=1 Tax=Vannielia litorea TaxID=1217970 RepID=A0A1N6GYZ5_9RHOB|nr:penicillin-insensitive murein endopeptidase [Vannielia litorea]SIO12739.1 murein endopeptidase. Metallo peptidase. MEROPS family M74 [Vannielia litorea]